MKRIHLPYGDPADYVQTFRGQGKLTLPQGASHALVVGEATYDGAPFVEGKVSGRKAIVGLTPETCIYVTIGARHTTVEAPQGLYDGPDGWAVVADGATAGHINGPAEGGIAKGARVTGKVMVTTAPGRPKVIKARRNGDLLFVQMSHRYTEPPTVKLDGAVYRPDWYEQVGCMFVMPVGEGTVRVGGKTVPTHYLRKSQEYMPVVYASTIDRGRIVLAYDEDILEWSGTVRGRQIRRTRVVGNCVVIDLLTTAPGPVTISGPPAKASTGPAVGLQDYEVRPPRTVEFVGGQATSTLLPIDITLRGRAITITYDTDIDPDSGISPFEPELGRQLFEFTIVLDDVGAAFAFDSITGPSIVLNLLADPPSSAVARVIFTNSEDTAWETADGLLLQNYDRVIRSEIEAPPGVDSINVAKAGVVITFNEPVTGNPAPSDFSVTVGGKDRPVKTVTIAGNQVLLGVELEANELPMVGYTPGESPLARKEPDGSAGPQVTRLPVRSAENVLEGVDPVLTDALGSEDTIQLALAQVLDANFVPAADAFAVEINGVPTAVGKVEIAGASIVLDMEPPKVGQSLQTVLHTADKIYVTWNTDTLDPAPELADFTVRGSRLTGITIEAGVVILDYTGNIGALITGPGFEDEPIRPVARDMAVPVLQEIKARGDNQLVIVYNEPVTISNQDNESRGWWSGFDADGTELWDHANAQSVLGNTVVITVDAIPATVSYGGGNWQRFPRYTPRDLALNRAPEFMAQAVAGGAAARKPAIGPDETIIVSYTPPDMEAARNLLGKLVAPMDRIHAQNITGSQTAPTVIVVEASGNRIFATFDRTLDPRSVPARTRFAILLPGHPIPGDLFPPTPGMPPTEAPNLPDPETPGPTERQVSYTTPGTYTHEIPAGVRMVTAQLQAGDGGGGGGGGGATGDARPGGMGGAGYRPGGRGGLSHRGRAGGQGGGGGGSQDVAGGDGGDGVNVAEVADTGGAANQPGKDGDSGGSGAGEGGGAGGGGGSGYSGGNTTVTHKGMVHTALKGGGGWRRRRRRR